MPSISEMNYGYDAAGVSQYIDDVKAEMLQKAANAVLDTKDIKKCCESNWEGHAKEVFLKDLDKDAKHVAEQYERLFHVFEGEIHSLQSAMQENDSRMFGLF